MNENTDFNLEWAKRGGVCATKDSVVIWLFTQRGFVEAAARDGRPFFWEMPTHGDLYKQAVDSDIRMATRAECVAAGIEYIERPTSTEDIEHIRGIEYARGFDDGIRKNEQDIGKLNEELRAETAMLDFMIENPSIWVEVGASEVLVQRVVGNYGAYQTQAEGATPREAIRTAMKDGEC